MLHMPFRLSLERHFCSTAEARCLSFGTGELLVDGLEPVFPPFGIFSSRVSGLDFDRGFELTSNRRVVGFRKEKGPETAAS